MKFHAHVIGSLFVLSQAFVAVGCGEGGAEDGPDDGVGATANGGKVTGGKSSGGGRATGGRTGAGGKAGTGGADGGGDGGGTVEVENPLTDPDTGPPAGNSEGGCPVPAEAGLEDISRPTTVVGSGDRASCTAEAFIAAVARGGVITFDCGDAPHTIELTEPAKIYNDANPEVVIDGGGLVTLSGAGRSRILYMNTCDESLHYTTSHCNDQDHPRLTVQNLTFVDANSGKADQGGGAIFARGGRFKVINSRFFNNSCAETGPDLGGAGIRVLDQFEGRPAYVVNSTFGGAPDLGNRCSNGGGISSIGVSWTILNSVFSYNSAVGRGANPAQDGLPGGGSGGAIYNDGKKMTLSVCGTLIENNRVNEHGSAIFFVSNDKTGDVRLEASTLRNNCGGTWYQEPGISAHDETPILIVDSTLSECVE